jgi:S1-C subfamily serine protease
MGPDDDGEDDLADLGAPLPPDDRLWRHPSELREHGATAGGPLPPVATRRRSTPQLRTVAATSALAGALVTLGVIAIAGIVFPRVVDRDVVQKVALEPIVSTPMVRTDRGVVDVAQKLEPALVRIDVTRSGSADSSSGSGVVFRDDGLVLTSAHIVQDPDAVVVHLSDGRRLPARVLGTDPLTDLAVLDVDGNGYAVAVLGTAKTLEVGAVAVALGSPMADAGSPTVSTGVISALGSSADGPEHAIHGLIQTDAPLWGSCSGGALVDATGAVIGITSAAAGGADRGVTYATPIDVARWVAEQIVRHGRPARGWLGVEGTDLPSERAVSTGLAGGALIRDVAEGSPAEDIGLGDDDVITQVDGRDISSMPGLVVELRDHSPGDTVEVTYWHDGKERTRTVELTERP